MRRNSKGRSGNAGEAERGIVRWSGVLHAPVQQPEGREIQDDDAGAEREVPACRPEFLLAFVRNLVREVSGDLLFLALAAARKETGATKEEEKLLIKALREEQKHSQWPTDFMPEI